jgi:hypothetical protein
LGLSRRTEFDDRSDVPRTLPALLAILCFGGPALAAAEPRVTVEGCPESLSRGLERFVGIELEPLSDGTREIDVQVGCGTDTVVLLISVDGQSQTRSMDLRAMAPSVRARMVALTAAEVVRELQALPPLPPRKESEPIAVDDGSRAPRKRDDSVGELEGFFQAAQFDLYGNVLLGGGLRFAYTDARPWRFALDFGASTYRYTSELGSVRLILASFGARIGHVVPLGSLALELGAGGRVGVARISGTPAAEEQVASGSVAGVWSAPFGFLGVAAPISGDWRVGADLEIGYVTSPVRGRVDEGDDVEVDELYTSLGLGVAVKL